MPFAIRASVDVRDLLARLDGMRRSVRTRVLKKAINAGTRVILREAKARCPRASGLLRKSLGRKVKVYRSSGAAVGIVGPRAGYRQEVTRTKGKWLPVTAYADPVRYAHLVEHGTAAHGKHPGAAARPFLAPAARAAAGEVRREMGSQIMAELAKAEGGEG